jgi:hypothetical protein
MMRTRNYLMIAPVVLMLFVAACGKNYDTESKDVTVTLDKGTELQVKPLNTLSPITDKAGDEFTATLDAPLMSGDQVVAPQGTTVVGKVVEAKAGEPGSEAGSYLTLQLNEIVVAGGQSINIETEPVRYAAKNEAMYQAEADQQQKPMEKGQTAQSAPEAVAPPVVPEDTTVVFRLAKSVDVPVAIDEGLAKPVS